MPSRASRPAQAGDDAVDPRPPSSPPLPDLLPDSAAPPFWLRAAFAAGGLALIALGVVVWVVPIVGGAVVLYVAGLLLLGRSSRHVRHFINRAERKLPERIRRALRIGRTRSGQEIR